MLRHTLHKFAPALARANLVRFGSTAAKASGASTASSVGVPPADTGVFSADTGLTSEYAFAPHLFTAEPTRTTALDNGLRVASEDMGGETATVGVYIDAGSRFETAETNGVAHFLEHMAFKGTEARTRAQLEKEIEAMGGHLNAYTARDQTVYYAKVLKKDVGQAVEILADILQNSTYSEEAIEMERSVIQMEYDHVNMEPEERVFDMLHDTAFQGTALGRTILGERTNIDNISREDLVNYVQTHYTAPRMVLAAAGGVSHDELVKLGEKHFGNVASLPPSGELVRAEPAKFTGSSFCETDESLPHAHFAVAVQGVGWAHPDAYPMMLMQTMLGEWDTSSLVGDASSLKMCSDVAENHLGPKVMAFNAFFRDTGLFGVYGHAHPDRVDKMAWRAQEEMVRMVHRVTPEQLGRARNQLMRTLLGTLDDTTSVADEIGRQMIVFGRRIPKSEVVARLDAVTPEKINEVADKYINDQEVAVAGLGRLSNLPDLNAFRRRTHWARF